MSQTEADLFYVCVVVPAFAEEQSPFILLVTSLEEEAYTLAGRAEADWGIDVKIIKHKQKPEDRYMPSYLGLQSVCFTKKTLLDQVDKKVSDLEQTLRIYKQEQEKLKYQLAVVEDLLQ